ncbi:Protein of unknown function [Niastella yeongjuensis]|nr:Protein of unknown function [Niastella yeongjuensis]
MAVAMILLPATRFVPYIKLSYMSPSLGTEYLQTTIRRLRYYKMLGEKTFEQLTDADFHYAPNEASNSIAVILQHVSGNMLSRWSNFLTEDGEKAWRNRDEEFKVHNYSKQQLLELWEKGWQCFLDALTALTENDLLKTIYIREEPLLVIDAINRQLAHYPYHVGQILYIGKLIKDNNWQSLSIEKGKSEDYNKSDGIKDPAKKH